MIEPPPLKNNHMWGKEFVRITKTQLLQGNGGEENSEARGTGHRSRRSRQGWESSRTASGTQEKC